MCKRLLVGRFLFALCLAELFPLTSLRAAGFITTFFANGDQYRIKTYEHITFELGTRRAAVMVISNPHYPENERTLVVFKDGRKEFKAAQGELSAEAPSPTPVGGPDNPYPGQNLFSENLSFRGVVDFENSLVQKNLNRPFILQDAFLRNIKEVIFKPEFNYRHPVKEGTPIKASLTLVFSNNRSIVIALSAGNTHRYLRSFHWSDSQGREVRRSTVKSMSCETDAAARNLAKKKARPRTAHAPQIPTVKKPRTARKATPLARDV